ncbi:MAG: alpha-glucosidase [Oscillibacter sp.]|nr:alpha-glucosidase [Oscillibacter sp.]
MIEKYVFGEPFETGAVVARIETAAGLPAVGTVTADRNGFRFTCTMAPKDIVYGLGEANRGINKRGYEYVSCCTDDGRHSEDVRQLYGAHNFLVIAGKKPVGLFFDYPGVLRFDIGYKRQDILEVSCDTADMALYVIEGESAYDIVKQFRKIIGRSYIPPKFAFGYGQSRYGYKTADDFREVVQKHREAGVPLDMVYMDIDYMERFKDFVPAPEIFPDFPAFVSELRARDIHLVPIVDAGIKTKEGYSVSDEGKEKGYFCKRADGSDFEAAVWPGWTNFPDVLNPEARAWFGGQYGLLTACGIDGFWNDMNEPAMFCSREGLAEAENREALDTAEQEAPLVMAEGLRWLKLFNNPEDYKRFYHNVNGKLVRHDQVHNLYGYNITRGASEGLSKLEPGKRFLLFSRASYIGAHRYGGIWTGDNHSWWSHILLNLKMLPSLNMCGFLYVGADLGGFNADTTRDLLLRWLALGVFTPLMRNHSGNDTRRQEFYQFEGPEDFRHVIGVRYRLLPYLYSEYMKAALHDDMMFKPLAFEYPDDEIAARTEDHLLLGSEVMIAPVYVQNACGRYVYLPEEMMLVKFLPDGTISQEVMPRGVHYIEVGLNEVPLFIRNGKGIPVADPAQSVPELDLSTLKMIGYENASYDRYDDDGVTIPE